jgi:hypothetical protein
MLDAGCSMLDAGFWAGFHLNSTLTDTTNQVSAFHYPASSIAQTPAALETTPDLQVQYITH